MTKALFVSICTLLLGLAFSQTTIAQPSCSCDTMQSPARFIDCTPIVLADSGKLAYQFDCDSIWLTLSYPHRSLQLYRSLHAQLYKQHLQLNPQFCKDFSKIILLSVGSAPTTAIAYWLVDKQTGNYTTYNELIYPATETNFLVSQQGTSFEIYNPENGQLSFVPIENAHFNGLLTELRFAPCRVEDGMLVIPYSFYDWEMREWQQTEAQLEIARFN